MKNRIESMKNRINIALTSAYMTLVMPMVAYADNGDVSLEGLVDVILKFMSRLIGLVGVVYAAIGIWQLIEANNEDRPDAKNKATKGMFTGIVLVAFALSVATIFKPYLVQFLTF